ncbi:hypothetical protein [Actinotalea sp. K2]|uniref:hypothetical protein n=1 Tax=Actinotalea sp. K2 TaxID=2939438 RepID=UPI0020173991|nr:hypothetical protein [Actinotalea sp. K2]MCL3860042.1 hypothetical protein [Actinotalea sp. K2]
MSATFSPDEPMDAADHAVLEALARVLDRVDPVPAGLVDRSLFALTLEGLHAEVTELRVLELAVPAVRGAGDRGTVEARTITFTSDPITVMITLSVAPSGGVRIDGWGAPAQRFSVELYRPGATVHAESDDGGSFVLPDVPRGPASLVLRPVDGAGPAVSTPVIEL